MAVISGNLGIWRGENVENIIGGEIAGVKVACERSHRQPLANRRNISNNGELAMKTI